MEESGQAVSFAAARGFGATFRSDLKETFFADDPFSRIRGEKSGLRRVKSALEYFIPIFEWLPAYNLRLLRFDLLTGLTITSLAIPQGISYANLASIPPIIGLYSSFVPPLIYAIFGNSKHLAVGNVAACSLIITDTIGSLAPPAEDPALYLHLVFTATLVTGIFQSLLGFLRLGMLVDFLSHSTITGFMGGTATLICLQQLKGIFGMKHFTTHTDVVSVIRAIIHNRHEWRWESAVVGVVFLVFLLSTKYIREKRPKLFWVPAMGPMVVVLVGCVFAYLIHGKDHGIQTVGKLSKGINPLSINLLNFDSKYLPAVFRAGMVTGLIALAEGIAIGRSFAIMNNTQVDGNKEMIAFGFMNIAGSLTSCYLTTGPFSKTAVNYNTGAKTAMSNVVMAVCMALTLLFLAPLFSYTPLVALSAIIVSAMLGFINYAEIVHLFKVDKFDFCISMAAFLGVAFVSMDVGLMLSVGLGLLRALLYVARPASCKLGKIENSILYRDMEQYPGSKAIPGIMVLQLGSPIFFANGNYIRERILRWIRDEEANPNSEVGVVEHVLLDLTGVSTIDVTGIETLVEVRKTLFARGIKMAIVNPRLRVMEKFMQSNFVEKVGKDNFFLSVEDAAEVSVSSLHKSKQNGDIDNIDPIVFERQSSGNNGTI